jgi:hypothetical protein
VCTRTHGHAHTHTSEHQLLQLRESLKKAEMVDDFAW